MYGKLSISVMATAVFFLLCQTLYAEDFGIIMEASGESTINRAGKNIGADFGQDLKVGDIINAGEGSMMIIVAYESCEEWKVTGPEQVLIETPSNIISLSGQLSPARRLPVCYKPEAFAYSGPNVMGGTLLRSGEGEGPDVAKIDQIRQNADLSNSELMSLLMFDLQNGDKDKALEYYNMLISKNPGATVPEPILKELGVAK